MKKIIYLFLAGCAFWSCNQNKPENENHDDKDSLSENISLTKLDLVEELAGVDNEYAILFDASGTEPFWMAHFSKDKIRIIVAAGRDSVIVERTNNDLNSKSDLKIKLPSGPDDILIIENKPCNAISGDVLERTVTLKCKGKDYTGCGSFKK